MYMYEGIYRDTAQLVIEKGNLGEGGSRGGG